MAVRRIASTTRAEHMRVGIVVTKFNAAIGERLLQSALKALAEAGVAESAISVASVPGALEAPLALQRMAQTGDYDALVALGAVIRGETYHFEVVSNESASGIASRHRRPTLGRMRSMTSPRIAGPLLRMPSSFKANMETAISILGTTSRHC